MSMDRSGNTGGEHKMHREVGILRRRYCVLQVSSAIFGNVIQNLNIQNDNILTGQRVDENQFALELLIRHLQVWRSGAFDLSIDS